MQKILGLLTTAAVSTLFVLNLGAIPAYAYSTTYTSGDLTVTMASGETVTVGCSANNLQVNGVTVTGGTNQCNVVDTIIVNGTTGNETMTFLMDATVYPNLVVLQMNGNDGNDTINGSTTLFSTALNGGNGNDTITNIGSSPFGGFHGGAGTDSFAWTATSENDTFSISAAGAVTLNAGTLAAGNLTGFESGNLNGGEGNDTLTTNLNSWSLAGGNGTDTLNVNASVLSSNGDAGNDTVNINQTAIVGGGAGDDIMYLNAGGAAIGGADNDTITVTNGGTAQGGAGNDTITSTLAGTSIDAQGDDGTDTFNFTATSGVDTVTCNPGCNINGITFSYTTFETTTIDFAGGNDTFVESVISDERVGFVANGGTVNLGDGNDNMRVKNAGLVDGGSGDDTIKGSPGNDTFKGGSGTDTLDFSWKTCTSFVCTQSATGTDTVIMNGTSGDDTITFGSFTAGQASDCEGDVFYCNLSSEYQGTVTNVGATDAIKWASTTTVNAAEGSDTVNMATWPLAFALNGENDNDTLTAGSGSGTISGGSGTDSATLNGTSGNDSAIITDTSFAYGSVSDTLSSLESLRVYLGGGTDVLNGSSLTLPLEAYGEASGDILSGGSNADILNGGAGDDNLVGNDGNDSLYPGAGASDSVLGNAGNDTVYIVGTSGNDSIVVGETTASFGANTANFTNVEAGNVDAGAGNDSVSVSEFFNIPWTLNGGSATDDLEVDAGGASYVEDGNTITITNHPTIAWSNFESIDVVNGPSPQSGGGTGGSTPSSPTTTTTTTTSGGSSQTSGTTSSIAGAATAAQAPNSVGQASTETPNATDASDEGSSESVAQAATNEGSGISKRDVILIGFGVFSLLGAVGILFWAFRKPSIAH